MSYKINKRYQELPQYQEILTLVDHGLVHGVVVNFKYIESNDFFIDACGAIWKKINDQNWFYINCGMNAKTQGESGPVYHRFDPGTLVREMKINKAKPAGIKSSYSESSFDFNFPTAKAYKCNKINKSFQELGCGEYFMAKNGYKIWRKKSPFVYRSGPHVGWYNAITQGHKGKRYATYSDTAKILHLTEDKNYMNSEDILTQIGVVDENLELDVTVRLQVPELETVASVGITCIKFNVAYTVDEEGDVNCVCSADLKIGDHVVHIIEKDKVIVNVKGEKLIIVPVNTVRQGFRIQVTGGCSDPVETMLRLGDSIAVKVSKRVE